MMIIWMVLQRIKKYQPKPERLGIVAGVVGGFGRLGMGCGWFGFDFGRLSAAASSTSDNQDHEPRSMSLARFALSPPTGILQMDIA
jgi:hypothetical protein